ncbi:uncharacterized protein TNCV_587091 [Trichonephila clavipes]|nr:uncharacterized protein TNCV_587091 [Trichonephila clavipes]
MAPKTKEISLDVRKHITELHEEGKSFREIGNILKLSFTTVGNIVKKYLETGSVENKLRPGGPSKLTSKTNDCKCQLTVRNVMHNAGLKARTRRKKPYISEVNINRKRRLEFAMKNENKPMDFWEKACIDVLRHNLLDSAKKLSMLKTFIFQQDNDPKHTAIVTKTWLLYHAPRRLETFPQSPDLNPIENLWMHLDTEVRKKM